LLRPDADQLVELLDPDSRHRGEGKPGALFKATEALIASPTPGNSTITNRSVSPIVAQAATSFPPHCWTISVAFVVRSPLIRWIASVEYLPVMIYVAMTISHVLDFLMVQGSPSNSGLMQGIRKLCQRGNSNANGFPASTPFLLQPEADLRCGRVSLRP